MTYAKMGRFAGVDARKFCGHTGAMMNRHIAVAVELLGSQAALARACGYSRSGINLVLHGRRKVTAELAVAIEEATGGEVPRVALRPDLFRPMRLPRAPLLVAHSL